MAQLALAATLIAMRSLRYRARTCTHAAGRILIHIINSISSSLFDRWSECAESFLLFESLRTLWLVLILSIILLNTWHLFNFFITLIWVSALGILCWRIIILFLTEIEFYLVQIKIDQFNLLNQTMHQSTTFLCNVFPKFNHFSQTLSQSNKFGEGSSPGHLYVIALGIERFKWAIDVEIDNPRLELRSHLALFRLVCIVAFNIVTIRVVSISFSFFLCIILVQIENFLQSATSCI